MKTNGECGEFEYVGSFVAEPIAKCKCEIQMDKD
jgi:hypothetical protein